MALKQDQRALLQLICERGKDYGDLAGLLGIPESEVRVKARTALTELGGADPDAEVGLTDYLLGQADPIGRADAVRTLQQDDELRDLATEIHVNLAALFPAAELPRLPEARGKRRRAAASPAAPKPVEREHPSEQKTETAAPGERRTRLIAGLAGAGVVLLFVILAVAGAFSSDDDPSSSDGAAAAAEAQREITPVALKPQGGSGVAGQADFGLVSDQLFVDLQLDGLDPEPSDDSVYVLWLMLTQDAGYPVTIIAPDGNGSVQDRFAVPTPVAVVVGSNARFVQISRSPAEGLQEQINQSLEAGAPVVAFSGQSLARGRIPLAEADEAPPEG